MLSGSDCYGSRLVPEIKGRDFTEVTLTERRVGHAETGAHVLGQQRNRRAVGDRIGLGEIFHGFDQQTLAVYVSRIGSSLPSSAGSQLGGRTRDGENFCH